MSITFVLLTLLVLWMLYFVNLDGETAHNRVSEQYKSCQAVLVEVHSIIMQLSTMENFKKSYDKFMDDRHVRRADASAEEASKPGELEAHTLSERQKYHIRTIFQSTTINVLSDVHQLSEREIDG